MQNIGVVVDNEFDHDHRVQKQVELLKNEGYNVFVLCFSFGKKYKDYKNIKVVRVNISKKIKNLLVLLSTNFSFYQFFWTKHISQFIDKYQLEALHSHDLYMSKSSRLGISKSLRTIPLILDLHENYPAAINSYQWATKGWRKHLVTPKKWYKKENEYLKYADKLIVLSESFKENLTHRFPFLSPKSIIVHSNLPNLKAFQSFEEDELQVNFSSKLTTLFYFGIVAKRRGIIDILPWIKKINEEEEKFHLLIIGPIDKANKNYFLEQINSFKLKKYITYIPWADVKYLPAYLKKVDIGLAPFQVNAQHDSGVANKIFQYMYGQLPILATNCKAQQELIESTNCGFIYNDFKSFEKYTEQLLNKDLRVQLGVNGKNELLNLYAKKIDQQFLKIYKEI